MKTTDQRHPALGVRRFSPAFTLIEMLIVISVISVLLGLLYGSLERARTFSRRAIAYTEVKNIEAAFKQYYAHYHTWPPTNLTSDKPQIIGQDDGFLIDSAIANLLEGKISSSVSTDNAIKSANPDRIPFIEFARRNSLGVPVNPFRLNTSTETRQYKVAFDLNNDSEIVFNEISNTTVYASIAVWTVIPGSTTASGNSVSSSSPVTTEILGSWTTFSK